MSVGQTRPNSFHELTGQCALILGDAIKNMTEREEALGASTKFAARVGILWNNWRR